MSDSVKVLYIDDDPGMGRLIARALEPQGFAVTHVETGDEGVRRAGSERFDVIALDHNLVNETGLQVFPRLRQVAPDVPVVYVTGSEDARVAVAALKAGAADYVWKDVQGHFRELLGEAIRASLAQEKMKREAAEAQRAIAEARDRAELLLHEVNHRVANSLAMVAALAHLQASAVSDPAARQALHEMRARIIAVASVHRRLYTSTDVRVVELDAYLRSLIDDLAAAIDEGEKGKLVTLRVAGSTLLPTDRAVPIGVIVTELLTNAFKYAYAPGTRGEIRVILERDADGFYLLAVEDDGVGWNGIGTPKGTGLGGRVMAAMAGNLQSKVEYRPVTRGTRAVIRFKA